MDGSAYVEMRNNLRWALVLRHHDRKGQLAGLVACSILYVTCHGVGLTVGGKGVRGGVGTVEVAGQVAIIIVRGLNSPRHLLKGRGGGIIIIKLCFFFFVLSQGYPYT